MTLRFAMISEHASPAALLGGEDGGGQNVYVDEISRALAKLGHEVDIFTRRNTADAPFVMHWSPGVRIVNVPAGPEHFLPKDELWPLMPMFRDEMLRFVRRRGARYDVIHGNFWMSGWVACQLGTRLRAPVVQLFHALGSEKKRHQPEADGSPPQRIGVERSIVRRAERVIASCPRERMELLGTYGAKPSRIVTIPLGVDTEVFRPVDQLEAREQIGLQTDPDSRLITYVGRILPRKDVRNVVRALARLIEQAGPRTQQVTLLVVGGETREPDPVATPEIGELQTLAAELGVADRVVFTGMRGKEELRDYYGAGDVSVTTPWYEPFGLTPLEAMACGRPVIGSEVGGIAYTVQAGRTGLLVPPRDPNALAAAFAELLNDDVRRKAMGDAARRRVVEQFNWSHVAKRTAELYKQVIMEHDIRDLAVAQPTPAAAFEEIALGD